LVIVTSPSTGERLSEDYDVAPGNITVAPPGTDRGVPAKGSTDGTLRLLSVGAVVPRKGFDILIAALAPIAELPWQLTIAGDLTRDEPTVTKLFADIAQHQLSERVELLGAVPHEQVTRLYSSADIFVLASHFEGYGMAYAEAMAHGLPVIGTTGGATVDTVPPNAGVLVDPGNVKALTRALKMLIEDEKARAWFASGALAASAALPTWQSTARIVADALEDLI
jgi:glycosyltransferase involved in cell wall biosynthesis